MDTFKEYLEEQMDLKRPCTIKFRSVDGGISIITARITDMSSVADRDMIDTDACIHIGLDQIISVNDRQYENLC